MSLRFCEINEAYIKYLNSFDNKVPLPKKECQVNNRKYIGVILTVNNINYYVNLSSYKPKHDKIKDNIDFIKIKKMAVINLNNMIPVPISEIKVIDINSYDEKYATLLEEERISISKLEDKICSRAERLYNYYISHDKTDRLCKRCCDFIALESAMNDWISKK